MTDTAVVPAPAAAPAPTPAPTPAVPETPAEAASLLATKMGDKDFAAKYLAGDVAAKTEVGLLIRKKMEGDRIDSALSGTLPPGEPNVGGVSPQNLLGSIQHFRDELGLSDGAIKEALSGSPVNKETFDRAMQLRLERLSDPEWRDRWMKGGVLERREAMLLAIIRNNGISKKEEAA